MTLRRIQGKRIDVIDEAALGRLRGDRTLVLTDVGTGDGRFVLRWAQDHPDTFCIGFDPVAERLRKSSSKIGRKPSRGGVDNALFLQAAIEAPPAALLGLADRVTVNYPWGALLRAIIEPHSLPLANLVRLAKPGGRLTILLNASVFDDADYLDRQALAPFDLEAVDTRLAPALQVLGVEVTERSLFDGDAPYPTTWERRLVAGSNRSTLGIEMVRSDRTTD